MQGGAFLFVFLFSGVALFSQTLAEIEQKPSSRARDLLIWEFLLQKKISQAEARRAYALVADKNNIRIQKAYILHVQDNVAYTLTCQRRKDLKEIEDDRCLSMALSLSKTASLSRFERDELLARDIPKSFKTLLQLQNESVDVRRYMHYPSQVVISFLLRQPLSFWKKKLDPLVNEEFIAFLQQSPNFDRFVSFVVSNYTLDHLHKALLHVSPKQFSSNTDFLLAMNALRLGKKEKAKLYLHHGRENAYASKKRDKIDFWLYLVTKQRSYLQTLLLSMDINIYTLYAHEKLHVAVENYFVDIDTDDKLKSTEKLQDPFVWLSILQEVQNTPSDKLFNLAKKYTQKGMEPAARYIVERAYNFNMHGYLRPYDVYLNEAGMASDKIMLYALMRRESGYVPSALSRSFALGLMQLMPFLVDHLAKRNKEKLSSYTQMFEPKKNILYAWQHLQWLKKSLHANPLFIAYAYNGGYGFFTRYKKSGRFGVGEYEPFLSMETMRNSETREYGKYVLANFVMYKKIYHEPFSLIDFFQKLH